MKEKEYPESPVDALFSLAEEVKEKYNEIRFMGAYAYFFIGITTIILLFLLVVSVKGKNPGLFFLILALLVAGIILLRMIIITTRFIKYFVSRFDVINAIKNRDVFVPVPEGRDPVERARNFILSEKEGMKASEISIGGRKGYVISRGGLFSDYILLVEGRKIELKDIAEIEKAIEGIVKKRGVPSKLVIVYTARKYNGLPEGVYTYVVEGKGTVKKGRGMVHLPIQIFVEFDGKYDIIPPVMV